MRRSIILAVAGVALLAGCKSEGDKAGIPVGPKWKGEPYRIAFDTKPGTPSPAGITIPTIKYTANPDDLERRAILVVRFDSSGAKSTSPITDQMTMAPVDLTGAEGALPADYLAEADKGLGRILGAYCMKGKIKLSVALARSSLTPQAGDDELNEKRLSDWLPVEVVFKNPHPTC